MARIDAQTQERFSIPGLTLMENAGRAAWHILETGLATAEPIVFVAGSGNNGGDAYVMARHAAIDGYSNLTVVPVGNDPDPDSAPAINLAACRAYGIEVLGWDGAADRLQRATTIVDGLTGTGLRGPLRPPLDEVVSAINGTSARIVAIDVPSGVRDGFRRGEVAINADLTLTMGLPKECLYLPRARSLCGDIRVVRLGFPSQLVDAHDIPGRLLTIDDLACMPIIPQDTYKSRRGHVVVLAGAVGTTGAAWLSSHAAARSRAGLVTLYLDPDSYAATASAYFSVMVKSGQPDISRGQYTAFLAGPGWGLHAERGEQIRRLLDGDLPGVIDADGITLLAGMDGVTVGRGRVLTPHPGELSRLTGSSVDDILDAPLEHLRQVCTRLECVVVLKSHVTYVAHPDGRYGVLDGSNPWLATGGSGDVLAGVIAGLIASGQESYQAACNGVIIHGEAGRLAARDTGGFLAEDLLIHVSSLARFPHHGAAKNGANDGA